MGMERFGSRFSRHLRPPRRTLSELCVEPNCEILLQDSNEKCFTISCGSELRLDSLTSTRCAPRFRLIESAKGFGLSMMTESVGLKFRKEEATFALLLYRWRFFPISKLDEIFKF